MLRQQEQRPISKILKISQPNRPLFINGQTICWSRIAITMVLITGYIREQTVQIRNICRACTGDQRFCPSRNRLNRWKCKSKLYFLYFGRRRKLERIQRLHKNNRYFRKRKLAEQTLYSNTAAGWHKLYQDCISDRKYMAVQYEQTAADRWRSNSWRKSSCQSGCKRRKPSGRNQVQNVLWTKATKQENCRHRPETDTTLRAGLHSRKVEKK